MTNTIYQARKVMKQVGDQSDAHRWRGMAMLIVFGLIAGMVVSYFFFLQRLGDIDSRLNSLQQQQQTMPVAPAPDSKPANGKPEKGKKEH